MNEDIVRILNDETKAKSIIEIYDMLNLHGTEAQEKLENALRELVGTGIIHETRKHEFVLMKNCSSLSAGKISINKSGNGYVDIEGPLDVFVKGENLNNAINGDIVEIELFTNHGELEGRVIRVLKRDLSNIVGEMVKFRNKLIFKPDDEKLDIIINLTKESTKQCVEGHKVVVNILKEFGHNEYLGAVVKIIGHKNDPGVDIISIALRHGIEVEFNDEVIEELKSIPNEVSDNDLKGRKDLTKEMIFTIDGDDTKDIDDAISLEKKGDLYQLGVHIADVSYYVKVGTKLYETALMRGTSSYLADTVIPMIPHQLSNGICSLNPGVLRLTISCVMDINQNGKVVSYDIFPSYIKSNIKMTYKCVNKILKENIIPDGYEPYAEKLKEMQSLAHILRKERNDRGYIDFGLDEAKIIQDEKGRAIDVVRRIQDEGEKLIEDFMIIANETVATHVYNMDLPFIYRVHDDPNPEKIEDFMNLVKQLGYSIKTDMHKITPITMQKILLELDDKPEFAILSDVLLRSMKKAIYSPNNTGHFGLASKCYTHFTSPIRRFPDLTVHRLLRTYLFNNDMSIETINFNQKYLVDVAQIASDTEVASQEAERDVLDMKMAEYMERKIGNIYEGIISGVTSFGFFVTLDNLVEGLVHISTLKGYYNYVAELLSLVKENNSISYRLGDKVTIIVTNANKENGTIDFELYTGDKDGNSE